MTFWDEFRDRMLNAAGGAFIGVLLVGAAWLTPWATAPDGFSVAGTGVALAGAIIGFARDHRSGP